MFIQRTCESTSHTQPLTGTPRETIKMVLILRTRGIDLWAWLIPNLKVGVNERVESHTQCGNVTAQQPRLLVGNWSHLRAVESNSPST